jgi:hypothetical protein
VPCREKCPEVGSRVARTSEMVVVRCNARVSLSHVHDQISVAVVESLSYFSITFTLPVFCVVLAFRNDNLVMR